MHLRRAWMPVSTPLLGVMKERFDRVDACFDTLQARLDAHLDRHAS